MRKLLFKIGITMALLPLLAFGVHKYYISLTQIEYVKESASLQIISRYFINDLEHTLDKDYQQDFQLNTKQEIDSVDIYFQEYLEKNLRFTINDSLSNFNYIGKEYDDDIIYFYLEIPNIKTLQSIEIKNTALFKYFPDQQNITKLKINNTHTTFYLSKQKDKGLLNF